MAPNDWLLRSLCAFVIHASCVRWLTKKNNFSDWIIPHFVGRTFPAERLRICNYQVIHRHAIAESLIAETLKQRHRLNGLIYADDHLRCNVDDRILSLRLLISVSRLCMTVKRINE